MSQFFTAGWRSFRSRAWAFNVGADFFGSCSRAFTARPTRIDGRSALVAGEGPSFAIVAGVVAFAPRGFVIDCAGSVANAASLVIGGALFDDTAALIGLASASFAAHGTSLNVEWASFVAAGASFTFDDASFRGEGSAFNIAGASFTVAGTSGSAEEAPFEVESAAVGTKAALCRLAFASFVAEAAHGAFSAGSA